MHFEKVSFEQFKYDYCYANDISDLDEKKTDNLRQLWLDIKLPKRGTAQSAGYDFFMPYTLAFIPDTETLIPTGIRFSCDADKFLMCLPRSGLGFKYGMSLKNTAGVIDADYYNSDNEGHIMAKVTVKSSVLLEQGKGLMQGIILPYFKTDDDNEEKLRNGGFGSTGV